MAASRSPLPCGRWHAPGARVQCCFCVLLGVALSVAAVSGCGDRVQKPSAREFAEFRGTGAPGPSIDMDRILQAKPPTGPYRVVAGDVLHLELPAVVDTQWPESVGAPTGRQAHECRVSDRGTIILPIVGPFSVSDKLLAEIESEILAEYYPKYMKVQLPVYVSVQEYKTERVSIVGAVAQPGIYALRHDQMSLVALLMQAGNIVEEGATVVRIVRAGTVRPGSTVERLRGASESETGPRPLSATRAMFSREGPLRTTGWLALDAAEVSIRRWLDIGSRPQRAAFLGSVTGTSRRLGTITADLEVRLAELATCLGSDRDARDGTGAAGWRVMSDDCFVASLSGPGDHQGSPDESPTRPRDDEVEPTIVLPIRGLNIPFADAALQEGDSVIVERPAKQFVSVVGLVTRPGNMPCSPDSQYNLIQAIAFAGGLDLVADPRYVTVYRLRSDGSIASVRLRLVNPKAEHQLGEHLALPLRPGDVVSVEHTPRTRTNVFFDRTLRVSLGLFLNPDTLWDDG